MTKPLFSTLSASHGDLFSLALQAKISLENELYGEEVGRLQVARELAQEVITLAAKGKAQVRDKHCSNNVKRT